MKEIKGLIICGFPGVGKSYAEQLSNDIADCESNAFHFPVDWEHINEPEKMEVKEDKNWVNKYVDHIEDMASQYGKPYVLVSSHVEVRTEMDVRGIKYIIAVPKKELKDEYLSRYVKRGSQVSFIEKMYFYWEEWLDEIENCGMPVIHLSSGQYIADILPILPR